MLPKDFSKVERSGTSTGATPVNELSEVELCKEASSLDVRALEEAEVVLAVEETEETESLVSDIGKSPIKIRVRGDYERRGMMFDFRSISKK
jgi:hypothetical protein